MGVNATSRDCSYSCVTTASIKYTKPCEQSHPMVVLHHRIGVCTLVGSWYVSSEHSPVHACQRTSGSGRLKRVVFALPCVVEMKARSRNFTEMVRTTHAFHYLTSRHMRMRETLARSFSIRMVGVHIGWSESCFRRNMPACK